MEITAAGILAWIAAKKLTIGKAAGAAALYGIPHVIGVKNKKKAELVKRLTAAQEKRLDELKTDYLEALAKPNETDGVHSVIRHKNLKKLNELLCLDACHKRVMEELEPILNEIRKFVRKKKPRDCIRGARIPIRVHQPINKLIVQLTWNPELHEIFNATRETMETGATLAEMYPLLETDYSRDWPPMTHPQAQTFYRNLHYYLTLGFKSFIHHFYEDLHLFADLMRKTQEAKDIKAPENPTETKTEDIRQWVAAYHWAIMVWGGDLIWECDGFITNLVVDTETMTQIVDGDTITRKLPAKPRPLKLPWRGRTKRLKQLRYYRVCALQGRFEARRAVEHRDAEIDKLFKALGATDEQREAIKTHIETLYRGSHQLWLQDPWIERWTKPVLLRLPAWGGHNPFQHVQEKGLKSLRNMTAAWWRTDKPHNKGVRMFFQHIDSFNFQSPRHFTETAILNQITDIWWTQSKLFLGNLETNERLNETVTRVQEHELVDELDKASAEYKTATDIWPKEPLFQYMLAYTYAKQGKNLKAAVTAAQTALELYDPEDPQHQWLIASTHQVLGWLYLQQGDVKKALGELANPDLRHYACPLFYLVLGDAYKANGQERDAAISWHEGWEQANKHEWKNQDGRTPFDEKVRKDLGERLRRQENTE